MNKKEWVQIKTVVTGALAVEPAERHTYIRQACDGNDRLLREVEEQLRFITESEEIGFLENPGGDRRAFVQDLSRRWDQSVTPTELIGQRIGPYEIVNELGSGGMGAVYKAKRVDGAFHQTVAIKLIKRDVASEETIRRFKQEREILAGLHHPNIAQLYDGGVTKDGIPYLVMEFVDGEPITRYCKRKNLDLNSRLDLFLKVCEAVRYAHRNLVVHRDLKPSNILVTEDGVVKLLDFGVAKLLDDAAYDSATKTRAPLTQTGRPIMTPEYAAPEQFRAEKITTLADVYSLGVLLYELLTGVRPYDLSEKSFAEIERLVCEKEPPKLSAQTGRLPANPAGSSSPDKLRGDLDVICMKALRKEPEERYGSVQELQEDIKRHITGLPIAARPATARYRIRKFVRRHRTGTTVTALVILMIAGFITALIYQQSITRQERDQAQQEARRANQITQFLINVFEEADPENARGDTLNAYQILERGVTRLETELAGQPVQKAAIGNAIGQVYRKLGSYERARQLTEQALATRKKLYGPSHPDVAASLASLGEVYQRRGIYAKADSCYQEALAIINTTYGKKHPQWISYLNGRGQVLLGMGSYEAAEELFREAIDMGRQIHGRLHPEVAFSFDYLARTLKEQGEYESALPLTQQALAITRELYGNKHPDVAHYQANLGSIYFNMGDDKTAERYHKESLDLYRELLGENHPDVAASYGNVAATLSNQGQSKEAILMNRKALGILRHFYGEAHPHIAATLHNLGNDLREIGNYDEAESAFRDMLAIDQQLLGRDHPIVGTDKHVLAVVLRDKQNYDRAIAFHKEALALLENTLPPDHRQVGHARTGYGITLLLQNDPVAAEPFLRDGITILTKAYVDGHWSLADAQAWLGACLTKLERYEEAEALLTGAYARLREDRGLDDRYTHQSIRHLVSLYEAWEKPEKATEYRALLAEGL